MEWLDSANSRLMYSKMTFCSRPLLWESASSSQQSCKWPEVLRKEWQECNKSLMTWSSTNVKTPRLADHSSKEYQVEKEREHRLELSSLRIQVWYFWMSRQQALTLILPRRWWGRSRILPSLAERLYKLSISQIQTFLSSSINSCSWPKAKSSTSMRPVLL